MSYKCDFMQPTCCSILLSFIHTYVHKCLYEWVFLYVHVCMWLCKVFLRKLNKKTNLVSSIINWNSTQCSKYKSLPVCARFMFANLSYFLRLICICHVYTNLYKKVLLFKSFIILLLTEIIISLLNYFFRNLVPSFTKLP